MKNIRVQGNILPAMGYGEEMMRDLEEKQLITRMLMLCYQQRRLTLTE